MTFIRVENFLARFRQIAPEDLSPRVHNIIAKKFPKAKFDLKVKRGKIYLFNLSPALKNEIFLKMSEILQDLKKDLGKKAPQEISFQKL